MIEQTSEKRAAFRSSFLQPCRIISGITLRQTMRSKKTVFMSIVTSLPVLFAIYYRIWASSEARLSPGQVLPVIMTFFLQFLSVLVALFYGTALIADEIDNRTITCLFTRPVRKYSIIMGKFAAYMLQVSIVLIPPMLFTFLIIATGNGILSESVLGLRLFVKRLGVSMLALLVYGSVFTFFGAWWKRPVVLGLLFAFGWEKLVLIVPGTIGKFSIIHYLTSIFPKAFLIQKLRVALPNVSATSGSSPALSVIVLLAIAAAFLGLSIFTVYRKEYRFE